MGRQTTKSRSHIWLILLALLFPVFSWGQTPALDTAVTGASSDQTLEAATGGLILLGWSVRESASTAAAATVTLRHDADGTCDSTSVFAFIELNANESAWEWYGPRGIRATDGVCADITAGTVDINIFTSRP